MQKDSNNRDKQRKKLARLHEKVSNQRKDFLHKESRKLINDYDCICIENLDLRSMAKEGGFGKSIQDNGWNMFTDFLSYKAEGDGKKLIKVDRYFPSSQLCSYCGYKNEEVKDFTIRKWICPECGVHHDRDVNAARNILQEGKRLYELGII